MLIVNQNRLPKLVAAQYAIQLQSRQLLHHHFL
jgi:hypothetical protein